MRLENAGTWGDEAHAENGVAEAVKISQIAPVLVLPHIDVAVDREPCSRNLGKRKKN